MPTCSKALSEALKKLNHGALLHKNTIVYVFVRNLFHKSRKFSNVISWARSVSWDMRSFARGPCGVAARLFLSVRRGYAKQLLTNFQNNASSGISGIFIRGVKC